MLVKSASLCDDCYKTAEKHQHQQHTGSSPADHHNQQQQNQLTQSQNSSACISNISSTTSVSSVINKKQTDAMVESAAAAAAAVAETEISADDDGYCEIDEIRLPAITKSPSIKINDPRRQSAPAPLPPPETPPNDSIEQSQRDDATTAKPNHEHNKSTSQAADTTSDEQTQNTSASPPSSSGSAQTVVSNKHDGEHTEVNYAYDSLSQPLSALNLNNDTPSGSNAVGMPAPATLPPCDLMLKLLPYVTSLNQHISQLLVTQNNTKHTFDFAIFTKCGFVFGFFFFFAFSLK